MDIQDESDQPTQTSAAGLMRLASTIGELLREQAIDSRFGTKLYKRLEKEAKRVAEKGPAPLGKAEKAALKESIDALEHALRATRCRSARAGERPPARKRSGDGHQAR